MQCVKGCEPCTHGICMYIWNSPPAEFEMTWTQLLITSNNQPDLDLFNEHHPWATMGSSRNSLMVMSTAICGPILKYHHDSHCCCALVIWDERAISYIYPHRRGMCDGITFWSPKLDPLWARSEPQCICQSYFGTLGDGIWKLKICVSQRTTLNFSLCMCNRADYQASQRAVSKI